MKQTIPFKKDITFKTKIGELTSISLENDLTLKGEDLITGNFYINGTYKMLESSTIEEEYSYKIPCEIAISDDYDTFDAAIDIDDFSYEIIDEEVLRVNIVVVINNLERKQEEEYISFLTDEEDNRLEETKKIEEKPNEIEEQKKDLETEIKETKILDKIPEIERINNFFGVKEELKKQEETYLTYKIYIFKKEDTLKGVLEKYNITKEVLSNYNDLEDIKEGTKIVIPSFND